MSRFALFALCLIFSVAFVSPDSAEARGGYAKWLKHGDRYKVTGSFAAFNRTFSVRVAWKGSGFVIHTPLGVYRLKRRGNSVSFKAYIDKAWAHVTWSRTRATVRYKGQKGSAKVVKTGSGAGGEKASRRKHNFNKRK